MTIIERINNSNLSEDEASSAKERFEPGLSANLSEKTKSERSRGKTLHRLSTSSLRMTSVSLLKRKTNPVNKF